MRYRRFGKTNLQLSVFSLGTMRCLESDSTFLETLDKAIALGINHIETAKGYGKSEDYLGISFKRLSIPREQIYLTTKLSPTPAPHQMTHWIDESLSRLKLDYIDCLALHGVNTKEHLSWITADDGCMKALQQAKQAGKINHIGFSTHGSLELILATLETDLFEFINLHYYYFFQHNISAVQLASEKDMGIFIISPSDKGGRLYTPPETLKKLCEPLTPLELNYRFLLSDHRITTLSIGPATPTELLEPLQVADHGESLTDPEKTILKGLETHLETVLGSDQCRQCYQCLPCPETINIPEILRLRNLAIGYDMTDFAQYRYRMLENAGHWFPGKKGNRCTECGDCLPRCPENLDIPTLLSDTHQRLNGVSRRRLWEE